ADDLVAVAGGHQVAGAVHRIEVRVGGEGVGVADYFIAVGLEVDQVVVARDIVATAGVHQVAAAVDGVETGVGGTGHDMVVIAVDLVVHRIVRAGALNGIG